MHWGRPRSRPCRELGACEYGVIELTFVQGELKEKRAGQIQPDPGPGRDRRRRCAMHQRRRRWSTMRRLRERMFWAVNLTCCSRRRFS